MDKNKNHPERLSMKSKVKLFEDNSSVPVPNHAVRPKATVPTTRVNEHLKCDSKLFTTPMQLINIDEEGKFHCKDETIAELKTIDNPLNIVAVTGRFRTGKSYLLNRLSEQPRGFDIGHTTNAVTKGIWVWCRPHPTQEGQVLLLMDTEGIGDTFKTNRQEDIWLFTLATLLSSTLIYNTKGAFDADAIEKLSFLQEIESSISINGDETDESLMDIFFPELVVGLRDFGVEPVTRSGKRASPDQYLEECLMVERNKKGKHIETYNKNRLLIRKYFKKRTCFLFEQPCKTKKLKVLHTLHDNDLDEDFVETIKQFTAYIYSRLPNTLQSGHKINGRMFCNLTLHYTNSIRNGEAPSILEATRAMAEAENQYAVNAASNIYKKEMQKRIAEINPKDSALVDFHNECMAIAFNFFKNAVVIDDQDVLLDQAMVGIKKLFGDFKRICDRNSEGKCRDVLQRLDLKITKKMKNQAYRHPAGYDEYVTDINWVVKKYEGMTGLGSRSRAVLQEFIDGKVDQEKQVFQLVKEAQQCQQEETGIDISSNPSPGNLNDSITKSNSVRDKLMAQVIEMETQLEKDMVKTQVQGLEVIRKKCDENLRLKIKENERQIREHSGDIDAIKLLEAEAMHLNKLLEDAANITATKEDLGFSVENNTNPEDFEGTVYNAPWDRFVIDLKNKPRINLDEISDEDQQPDQSQHHLRKSPGKDRKRCTIQ